MWLEWSFSSFCMVSFFGAFIWLLPSILMVCILLLVCVRSLIGILYLQTLAFNVGEMGVRVGIGYLVYPSAALAGTPISGYVPHHLVAHS